MYTDVVIIWLNLYTYIRLFYPAEVWSSLLTVYYFKRKVTCNNFLQMFHILVEICWTNSAMQTALLYRLNIFVTVLRSQRVTKTGDQKVPIIIISIIITHHFNRMTYRLTLWCPMTIERSIKPAKIDWMKLSKWCSHVHWKNLDLN